MLPIHRDTGFHMTIVPYDVRQCEPESLGFVRENEYRVAPRLFVAQQPQRTVIEVLDEKFDDARIGFAKRIVVAMRKDFKQLAVHRMKIFSWNRCNKVRGLTVFIL